MTDDDSVLNASETARWDAIVSSEWPSETAMLITYMDSDDDTPLVAADAPSALTVYLPRRPRITPLAAAALMTIVDTWVAIHGLAPAYHLAVMSEVSRHERGVQIDQITIMAAIVTVLTVLAVGLVATWLVVFARYRLRRSSCDQVTSGSNLITACVRPPNPATAAAAVLLLLCGSVAAGWWIPLHLERATANSVAAIEALRLAAVGGFAWLAVFLVCATGLATWAAREARHRLRRTATHVALAALHTP